MDVEDTPLVEKHQGLPWVEKYRPNSLQDLIAHEDIIKILNQLIESNKLPHLLFYGPPGTGRNEMPPPLFFFVSFAFLNNSLLSFQRQNLHDHCLREEAVRRALRLHDA